MPTHELAAADGLRLHVREWPCPAARGTVLVVHGLGEHIGRYEAVAARLNEWGWRVVGHDQRGHGRSGGARGDIGRQPDALLDDLARMIDAQRGSPDAPLVLFGHSMGGLIASRFVAEALAPQPAPWHRGVDALVLSSPALDPGMTGVQKFLLAVMGRLVPRVAVHNGLKPDWISRDATVVDAYTADRMVHDRVTAALVRFIVDGGESVRAAARRWRIPTLLLYAGADRCVAPAGSAAFSAAADPKVVTTREFPGLYHEIFNEPERDDVFAVLHRWLDEHATA